MSFGKLWPVVFLALVSLSGCKKPPPANSPEGIVQEGVDCVLAVSTALDSATDDASAERATPVIERETAHMKQLRERLLALAPLRPSEKAKRLSGAIFKSRDAILQSSSDVTQRILSRKISPDPGKKLMQALGDFAKEMTDYAKTGEPLLE
jgi:hypothetical protein